jgi:transposase InsO family protein
MGWKECGVLEQRKEFIKEYLDGNEDLKCLCKKYGISEKTGHKWKNRFLEKGISGLADKSKAPLKSPAQLDENTIINLIALKLAHPNWGPKKILVLFCKAYPGKNPPSLSSVHRVLQKAGLVKKRRVRNINTAIPSNLAEAKEPNDVWTVDFKGWWYSEGQQCLPLTVRDLVCRYILDIKLMQKSTAEAVKEVFIALFKKYGLPKAIRSDNGPPVASTNGQLGLTTLSAWWITLGITPERIKPGCPYENGSHERMHADLAGEVQNKIPGGISANQAALNLWAEQYNSLRPHEALGMKTPSDLYKKSTVHFSGEPFELEYPFTFSTRKVSNNGRIIISGQSIMISTALRSLDLGLQFLGNKEYRLWLAEHQLGIVNTEKYCFQRLGVVE